MLDSSSGDALPDRSGRRQMLASLGASDSELAELLAYTENHFHPAHLPEKIVLPLDPEPHVAVWKAYAASVGQRGSIEPLRDVFVQLRFPIRAGMSEDETYRAATRRGIDPGTQPDAVRLRAPFRLIIHEHPAGPVPAFITNDREDFVTLVRVFTERNEAALVPDSQGAVVVAGFNNWDRIRRAGGDWNALDKAQYQDRFLIISDGPYSGVRASEIGLDDAEWRRRSVALRLEHEAAHYFTRRVFNSMKNRVHDELIADWAGIRAAAGRYRADWFLRFMGLEAFPSYRDGGRLQNYRTSPAPLSDGAFRVLQALTERAARTLEIFDRDRHYDPGDRRTLAIGLIALAMVTLDEMASDDGLIALEHAAAGANARVEWRPA